MERGIPPIFISRKTKILADLATPEAEYSDASPKGSVDEGIRNLIEEVNSLPGLVTTSSCAGRISVFLEGRRDLVQAAETSDASEQRKFVPSGGKGAGRWLYISHDPLMVGSGAEDKEQKALRLHGLFGMVPGDGKPPSVHEEGQRQAPRLVRFHYEPMILHVMAATLHHAQPVLSAASSSGFRESGVQGLRCLEGDNGPSPIVAVRSAGLALESVIGYCEETKNDESGSVEPVIRSLVSEEYLQMLVNMSNERFSINAERKERFRAALLRSFPLGSTSGTKGQGGLRPREWEDPEKRKERKRAEGLMRKKLLESQALQAGDQNKISQDDEEPLYLMNT